MEFVTAYGPKNKSTFNTEGPTMTKQAFRQESDVNFIIARFEKTGVLEHRNEYDGQYGEFAEIDYHEAMNIVAAADSMFNTIPSSIRKQFGNDPGAFLDFVTDPKNREAMEQMGLANAPHKPTDPEPLPAEPGSQEPTTEPAQPAN